MKAPLIFRILILCLFPLSLLAQDVYLTGKIYNKQHKPIEFANINLSQPTTGLTYSTITDSLGFFSLKVKPGEYVFQASVLGKLLLKKTLNILHNESVGTLELENTHQLESITITGSKKLFERKIDRIVFNVENSVLSQGANGLEILRITPNIRTDDNKIQIVGKSSMAVMVNNQLLPISGRDLTEYIKSLRSEEIKSIEVITTPPAQFDATGNSGIINIVLKKAKKNSWNANVTSSFRQSKVSQFSESASFTYNENRLTTYINLSNDNGIDYYRTENGHTVYSDKETHSLSIMKDKNDLAIRGRAGLDYDINTKLSAGIFYTGTKTDIAGEEINNTRIYSSSNYSLQTTAKAPENDINNRYNIHSTYLLDSIGSRIFINADFFDFRKSKNRTFYTQQFDDFTNHNPLLDFAANNGSNQRFKNHAAKIDVEHKFKKWSISYGSKYTNTTTNSEVVFYDLSSGAPILDPQKSDEFDYSEKIFAFYSSAQITFSQKWEIQTGLRMESSHTNGFSHNLNQTNKRSFTNLFPSLFLLFKADKENTFSFSYSRRIDRPSYRSLNPFVRYITPYTTSEGNPFLQPYFTHNLELNYNYKENWSSSLYLSRFTNGFEQLERLNSNNINSITKYENYYNELTVGLTENYNFHPVKDWESNNSANILYTKVRSFIPETVQNPAGWTGSFETNNTYALNQNKTYFLSANYSLQLPGYSGVYKFKSFSGLSLGLKAQYLQKKLTANIFLSDILRTQKSRNTSYYDNIRINFSNYEDRRALQFSLSYSFGKSTSSAKKVTTSNEEEAERAH